jgi:hypothetical protein
VKLKRAKDYADTGNQLVVDDDGNTIATVYFDRQSNAWFDADAGMGKHHMHGYLGFSKEDMFRKLGERPQKNPPEPPPDFMDAVKGYKRFTKFDPQEFGILEGFQMPSELMYIGDAYHILYRSDKWESKFNDYIHEHEAGVGVYVPTDSMIDEGPLEEVPSWLKKVESLYLLGLCLGFQYKNAAGRKSDAEARPYPELYAVPSGRALLIIDVKGPRARLEAALWGGMLDVRPEGITG